MNAPKRVLPDPLAPTMMMDVPVAIESASGTVGMNVKGISQV
jgi:hypothetical protein